MIDEEREAEIRSEARKRCLDEIEALSKNESIEFGIGCDVNRVYCFAMQRYSQRESVHNIQNISIVELIGSCITEYSDWCWENLERASVGKELLPRLEWDKPQRSLRTYVDGKYFHQDNKILRDGEPCGHPGCLKHISHPCEGCGRIGGRKVGEKI